MANIIITSACNLRCPYCFAQEFLDEAQNGGKPVFLSLDDFESRLDFLERSGINEIRLIGGEPTLHPHFPQLIERALRRQKHIVVFSSGLISERSLACLEALPVEQCTVLVNMNATRSAGGEPTQPEMAQRRAVINRLRERVLPGFNIYSPRFEMEFLLPIMLEAGCQRVIRLGLAQPTLNGQNVFLHPKHYPIVGSKVVAFARRAAAAGITLDLDCGFVRCMFAPADLEVLRWSGVVFEPRCNAILDIDLEGQAIHCFPLTSVAQIPMNSTTNADMLRTALELQMMPFRSAGIYKECSTCPFKRQGECTGGCLASTLRRFQNTPIHIRVPVDRGY